MRIDKVKVQYLTIGMVIAAAITVSGMASALPSFVSAFKDYQATSEYENVDIGIVYKPKEKGFYEQSVVQMEGLYPEFKFVAEPNSITFSSDDLENHGSVNFIMTEFKAIEPGVFWSVDDGCLGRACPQKIRFKVSAKTLTINSQEK